MADNFRDKYRTKSLRLEGFDYSSEAVYFITVCTENKAHFFGKIQNDHIALSSAGLIVATEWMRTSEIRPRAVLGEWVVMPNHFHALLYIKPKKETCRDGSHPSETNRNKDYKNEFGPQRNNLSSIVRGFKSVCTRKIRENGEKKFSWQRGFYDHIVRNQNALLKIEEYIRENPRRWVDDKYYGDHEYF